MRGPAGIYGARKLTEAGHRVVLINRDIKPGGLAEYGIFVDKEKMKTGLRKQFKKILADPKVFYLGHVMVGQNQPLSLKDLQDMGFGAVVVTAGAQGTKKLGIEGEEAVGVYHAKDVVYHFNSLPPFSERQFEIGRRVAIIGMGNVMVDIANWLLNLKKIDQVVVVARRGPLEKAYDDSEFEYIDMYLDNADMKQEIERISGSLTAVGQDVGCDHAKNGASRRALGRAPADFPLSLLAEQSHRQRPRPGRVPGSGRKRDDSARRQNRRQGDRQDPTHRSRLRDLRHRRSGRCCTRSAIFTRRLFDQSGKTSGRS